LFLDSFFKASIENSFLEDIQRCKNIVYLSATPMQDKYLSEMNEFKDLDFYFLDWSCSPFISKLMINRKHVSSLGAEAGNIIKDYLSEDYPIIVTEDKRIVKSKEAVFYFNSVNEITKLVKKHNLSVDQVNILCADTDYNRDRLKKIKHEIGKIPLKGEPNKMFTFCTSTCYIGSDFYSDNASTYIFADPNLEYLALDISLDLPQIAGRQRNIDNPFKNIINLFYKTLREENELSEERFRALQDLRKQRTHSLIDVYYSSEAEAQEALWARFSNDEYKYVTDFVSVSKKGVVYNKLIEIANERAFQIQQKDYQDDINVTRTIENFVPNVEDISEYKDKFDKIVDKFLTTEFMSTGIFEHKLKYFCEFMDKYGENPYIRDQIRYKIPDLRYHNFYILFGTARCKTLLWKSINLSRAIEDMLNSDKLRVATYNSFEVGKRYTKKEIKSRIGEIYRVLKISSNPKASDINKWFETKTVLMVDPITKQKDSGFELLSRKDSISL
jgi:hypothetical protein